MQNFDLSGLSMKNISKITWKKEKDYILRIVYITGFQKVAFLKAEKNIIQINLVKEIIQINSVKDTLIKSKDSKFESLYDSSGSHTHTHQGTHIILG